MAFLEVFHFYVIYFLMTLKRNSGRRFETLGFIFSRSQSCYLLTIILTKNNLYKKNSAISVSGNLLHVINRYIKWILTNLFYYEHSGRLLEYVYLLSLYHHKAILVHLDFLNFYIPKQLSKEIRLETKENRKLYIRLKLSKWRTKFITHKITILNGTDERREGSLI